MYLKKIEIQGFKTFADAVTLEFPPGANITAVVGPNGCGKSNFLEAVRWGMGEQNTRQLRSASAEEIIFAGSNARKPVSMAEVTITIDNSAKTLAVDYAEVVIRRRLYRSGESEYYLNKTLCRLKDINDLFMDTGVGKNSYSVIGQGQIDILINMKPEEKKRMFEEAAGINKYKHRKQQALRKLQATAEHLSRLSDLRGEVDGQLTTLERQAKDAEKYLQLKEELGRAETAHFSRQLELLNSQQQELETRIRDLRGQILANEDQTRAKERERQQQRRQVEESERALRMVREERAPIALEIEKITSFLLARADAQKEEGSPRESLAMERERILAEKDLIAEQMAAAKVEYEKYAQEHTKIAAAFAAARDGQASARARLATAEKELNLTREEYNHNRSRLNLLEELEKSHEGYFQGVKAVLEAKDNGRFPGVIGVVADVISADKNLETALETALGNHVQDIITSDDSTAKEAIAFLKRRGQGRATFLPLNILDEKRSRQGPVAPLPTWPGIKGRAADLVKYQDRFSSVVDNLLSTVAIAENLDTAVDFVRRYRSKDISRVVTLEGEVMMMSGAMTGGSSGQKTVPVLGRQRIMRELKQATIKAQTKISAWEEQLPAERLKQTGADDNLVEYRIQAGKLAELREQSQIKITALQGAEKDILAKLADKEAAHNALRRRQEIAETEQKAQKEKLPYWQQKLSELGSQEAQLQAAYDRQSAALNALEQSSGGALTNDHALQEKLRYAEVSQAKIEAEKQMIADRLRDEYETTMEAILAQQHSIEYLPEQINDLKRDLKRLEPVNLLAIEDYALKKEKEANLNEQYGDLIAAKDNLNKLIKELDNLALKEFKQTLKVIQHNFQDTFSKLFEGGQAEITVLDAEDVLNSGVDILVTLPRKKKQAMTLLSGGEKSLTAVALIFALLKTRPAPFCLLDEVDAALDEANIRRFSQMLATFSLDSQMVIITHNKQTLTAAQAIYGVTMQEAGISKVVSVKMG